MAKYNKGQAEKDVWPPQLMVLNNHYRSQNIVPLGQNFAAIIKFLIPEALAIHFEVSDLF